MTSQSGETRNGRQTVCEHGGLRRKCESCQRDVMEQVLDHAGLALRLCDIDTLVKVIFVWEQRGTYLLSGSETWEQQNVEQPVLGGLHTDGGTDGPS